MTRTSTLKAKLNSGNTGDGAGFHLKAGAKDPHAKPPAATPAAGNAGKEKEL